MRELLEKKKNAAKIFTAVLGLCTALTFLFIVLSLSESLAEETKDSLFLVGLLSLYTTLILYIIWVVKYIGVFSIEKRLKKRELEHTMDDINLAQPVLPKSKIYCGSKALFSKKPFTILPYSEIAWVYIEVRKLYGLIPIAKSTNILTADGKRFILKADVDEFKWLLENHLVRMNPNMIIGFGEQQKQRYKAVKAAYKASLK